MTAAAEKLLYVEWDKCRWSQRQRFVSKNLIILSLSACLSTAQCRMSGQEWAPFCVIFPKYRWSRGLSLVCLLTGSPAHAP